MDDGHDTGLHATDLANPFTSVPVEIVVSVGKARPLVRDLVQLEKNSVLTLDRRVSDPVELFIGGRLIARGELEEVDGDHGSQLAVRLIEITGQATGA